MRKDKHTLDKILGECFKLFLQKGYKEVTIPDIENAIGMTRGAVFYYFKDKQELFKAVIDKYIIENQGIPNKINLNDESGLLRFIINYAEGIHRNRESFQPSSNYPGGLLSYLNLFNSALIYYDGFKEKAALILEQEILLWEKVIETAKISQEIRDNVNSTITAKKFQRLFYSESILNGIVTDFNSSELLEICIEEYNLIKL